MDKKVKLPTKNPPKESDFQAKIIKWLKAHGCIVVKYQQNATTQAGIPDILFFKTQFWGAIEVKRSKNAHFQPRQKEMIKKMDEWSWARAVYPENWDETKKELEFMLND